MFCRYCGKNVEDGATFCRFCGKKFGESNPLKKISKVPYAMAEGMKGKKGDGLQLTAKTRRLLTTICVMVIGVCLIGMVREDDSDDYYNYNNYFATNSGTTSTNSGSNQSGTVQNNAGGSATQNTVGNSTNTSASTEEWTFHVMGIPRFTDCGGTDIGFKTNYESDSTASYQKKAGDIASVKNDVRVILAYTEILKSRYGFSVEEIAMTHPDEILGQFIYGWHCTCDGPNDEESGIVITYEGFTNGYQGYLSMTYSTDLVFVDSDGNGNITEIPTWEPPSSSSSGAASGYVPSVNPSSGGTGIKCSCDNGYTKCYYCDRGFRSCTLCHGTGSVSYYGQPSSDCNNCLNGQMECGMCDGGWNRCLMCGGDGEL